MKKSDQIVFPTPQIIVPQFGGNLSRRKLLKKAGAIGAMALGASSILKVQAIDSDGEPLWKYTNNWVLEVSGPHSSSADAIAFATAWKANQVNPSTTYFAMNGPAESPHYAPDSPNKLKSWFYEAAYTSWPEKISTTYGTCGSVYDPDTPGDKKYYGIIQCWGTKWVAGPYT